jgi:hypothetical protein
VLLVLLGVACHPSGAPAALEEEPDSAHSDRDGDGHAAEDGDCDDADASVHPDALEACDTLDNDCDGVADEEPTTDPPTWHQDTDGDGYGASDGSRTQCLPPADDWVLEDTDCDDTTADIHPGADERCNGVDDDCDGVEDDPPVVDTPGWYADDDGDGFGDDTRTACLPAEGFVDVPGDCDDTNADIHPAAAEVCNDAQDNDCDGGPNECVWERSIYMPDETVIGSPYGVETVGYTGLAADLDGDGQDELLIGSSTAWSPELGASVGSVTVFSTPILEDTDLTAADWTWWGDCDLCGVGSALLAHDLNGDGWVDIQIGAGTREVDGLAYAGSLYTLYGPLDSSSAGAAHLQADATLVGTEAEQSVGERAYALGDIDGDGLPDFGVGYEWYSNTGVEHAGVAYVFTHTPTGEEEASSVAVATIIGQNTRDEIGADGCGADLDGDGYSDVVLSAEGHDYDTTDGAALIYFGPVAGTLSSSDADVLLYAEGTGDLAGKSVAAPGDVNDDGLEDLLVGGPQAGDGSAYLLWGSPTLSTRTLGDAEVTFRASRADQRVGYIVRGLGDLDADGTEDIFLSEGPNTNSWGYVFFGPFDTPGTHYMVDADITLSADHYDGIYTTAFTPGDATGDGVFDLVVGSYKHGALDWDGAVYIMDGTGL